MLGIVVGRGNGNQTQIAPATGQAFHQLQCSFFWQGFPRAQSLSRVIGTSFGDAT
jgi:hypothetical protein